jgi:hypothetical protein
MVLAPYIAHIFAVARGLDLVEIVLVELANETRHVTVLEVFRQNGSREALSLRSH